MSAEEKFLKILKVRPEKPSLEFLNRIVSSHLSHVPWENVSKLLQKQKGDLSIPSFSNYVDGLVEHRFGGTCHAQNTHFAHLLNSLGFKAKLVSSFPSGLPPEHVAVIVSLEGSRYFVDLGLMSSFAGAFLLSPDALVEKAIGDQRFVFQPLSGHENYRLEIYRGSRLVRSYQSSSEPLSSKQHAEAIRASFADSAYFMRLLAVHRHFEGEDVGVWNNRIYFNRGPQREVRKVDSVEELESVLTKKLDLPGFPVQEIVTELLGRGCDIFSDFEES